jgi:hypothetical protein
MCANQLHRRSLRPLSVRLAMVQVGSGFAYNHSVEGLHTCRSPDGTIRSSGTLVLGARSGPGYRLTWSEQLTTHGEYKADG